MSGKPILVLAAAALLALPARGEEPVRIALALPEVPLFLEGGGTVRIPFDAGRPLDGATGAGLHLQGSGDFHRSICWDFGDYGGGQWTYREDEGLRAILQVGGTVIAEAALVFAQGDDPDLIGVNFDDMLLLAGGDWSLLAAGTGTLELAGLDCTHAPSYPEVCVCDPSAGLLAATLVVVFDDEVSAARVAWGAVRARYR